MERIRQYTNKTLIAVIVAVITLLFPANVLAAEVLTEPVSPEPIASSATDDLNDPKPGPTKPTGADGKTYRYNATTGLWENDHYTWNPTTRETKSRDSNAPTYNSTTKTWDTTKWQYDAPSGKYVPAVTSKPATVTPPETASTTALVAPSTDQQDDKPAAGAASGAHGAAVAQVGNTITSSAQSGNATVARNTTAGAATSGPANAASNVLNLLQSSWTAGGNPQGAPVVFTSDINGSVFGDILIDPASFGAEVNSDATPFSHPDLAVHSTMSGVIDNTITTRSVSGDATVAQNTTAGSAESGDATALTNVINLINSSIIAGRSFIGTININGDFEGDILLPEYLRQQLLARGNGSASKGIGITDSQQIVNNVALAAATGSATVSGNTTAGSATTGNAQTNLSIFNLTGRQVIGSNAILVFVNVLGQWVGMIVDAPAGTTTAMLGDATTTSSGAASADHLASPTESKINNTILTEAVSGDATVTGNTNAGDARTGGAKAAVNIASVTGSQLSFANWFGILFINVWGSWRGSFGVDTAMGDLQPPDPKEGVTNASGRVFEFIAAPEKRAAKPSNALPIQKGRTLAVKTVAYHTIPAQEEGEVFGATMDEESLPPALKEVKGVNYWIMVMTACVAALLLGGERIVARAQRNRNA